MSDREVHRQAWPEYELPVVSYGLPYFEACAKHVKNDMNAQRVYLIVSSSLARNGDYVEKLTQAIGKDSIAGLRVGIQPHSMYSEVLQVREDLEKLKIDCLVTLGGGSIIDGAKGAILVSQASGWLAPLTYQALANDAKSLQALDELLVKSWQGDVNGSTTPMISIPTTLSAGEYNALGANTNDVTHKKQLFRNPTQEPRLVILDPSLTMTTPPRVWFSTGVRALDHCVEAVCSIKADDRASTDFLTSIQALTRGLLESRQDMGNLDARMACQIGSMSFQKVMRLGIPLGASHGIGRQLGAYKVPHGETSCILMPAVAKYNSVVNQAQQATVLNALWGEETIANLLRGQNLDTNSSLADVLNTFIRALGMPRNLKTVGIYPENFKAIAASSLNDPWCKSNPVPLVREEQVVEILDLVATDEKAF